MIAGNWLKTGILMAGIMALFGAVGASLGGSEGMLLALLLGGAMNFRAYWFSDTMVLRLCNAREVEAAGAPQLYSIVRSLAPRALADALVKIDRYARAMPLEGAEAHPATAQMMIINPLSGGGIAGLFSTHPSTEERVRRLLEMTPRR